MATERTAVRVNSPAYQAYQILHIAFTVAPVVAGIDKFFHFLVNWDQYLSRSCRARSGSRRTVSCWALA
jgi:hypothetical protein